MIPCLFVGVFLIVQGQKTNLSLCCTPYIMDSPSSINTRQRERQTGSASISVTQSHLIPFALWKDSHYPTGHWASNQLLFNQVHLYLVSVTWISMFILSTLFCVRRVVLLSASQHFIIIQTWTASLWVVVWNLAQSLLISIILFLYPLCVGLLRE